MKVTFWEGLPNQCYDQSKLHYKKGDMVSWIIGNNVVKGRIEAQYVSFAQRNEPIYWAVLLSEDEEPGELIPVHEARLSNGLTPV